VTGLHRSAEDEPATTGRPAMPRQRPWPGSVFAGGADHPDAYELIGDGIAGGEGVIWRALDHHLRAPALCAVKMLTRPSAADRRLLEQNKRLLQHLSPRNVVRVHDIVYGAPPHPLGQPDPRAPQVAYVIMDWVEGPTLRQLVAGRPATAATIMERLRYIGQLAGALADLMPMNANASLHRDVKPGNCIIHPRHGLVLIDVTTLRRTDDGFDPSGMHTPEYSAPEVRAAPRRPRTTATEMYSLGAVAAFCLTGFDPDTAGPDLSRTRWLAGLMHAASEAGVSEPDTFVRHLVSAMDPDPSRRPTDLVAWSQTLIQLAVRTPPSRSAPASSLHRQRRGGAPTRGRRTLGRRSKIWASVAAAVILAGLAVRLSQNGADDSTGVLVAPVASIPAVVRSTPPGALSTTTIATTAPTASKTTDGPGSSRPTPLRTTSSNPPPEPDPIVLTRGTITSPPSGSDVKSCSYFTGTAQLPPATTLILTKRNTTTGNPEVYAELVHNWSDPSSLTSWRGAQYFGGDNDSVGQSYEVDLRAVSMEDAQRLGDANDFGQALAKRGTQLDTIPVDRVSGEGPHGCEGS